MDNGDKDDPTSPSRNNLFENAAANLLGVSPFGLPYAAHLAHIPSAYLMGHPAFPGTSLFGGLGDGMFGHFPSSLATSTGTIGSIITTPPISLDLACNGLPLSITIPTLTTSALTTSASTSRDDSSASAFNSLFTSASKGSPYQKPSPKSRSPASSPRTTITKATTTVSTTTTSSCSNSISRKPLNIPVVSGSSGVSLLSGKVKKGRQPKTDSVHQSKTNGLSVDDSLHSPPNCKSALNLCTKQDRKENGTLENDCRSDISTGSDENLMVNGGENLANMADSEATDLSTSKQNSAPTIHIDGLKKKLIADQIRQRVQNKANHNPSPSIMQPMKGRRGRPPKSQTSEEIALDRIQEYKKQQEELRRQLEANVKEHELELQRKESEKLSQINDTLQGQFFKKKQLEKELEKEHEAILHKQLLEKEIELRNQQLKKEKLEKGHKEFLQKQQMELEEELQKRSKHLKAQRDLLEQEYKRKQLEEEKEGESKRRQLEKQYELEMKMQKKNKHIVDKETSAKISHLLEAHGHNRDEASKSKSKSLQASIDKLKAASKGGSASTHKDSASHRIKSPTHKLSSPTHRSKLGSPTHKNRETPMSPKLGSPSHKSRETPMSPQLGSPSRKRSQSPSHKHSESQLSSKLGSPPRRQRDTPLSPKIASPTERSKLFAETLFDKIRKEVERENASDDIYTRLRTDSEPSQTHDDEDSSDSYGSLAIEYDSEDKTGESDGSNRGMKRSADELSEDYEGSTSSSNKRPRVQTDESILKIPLDRGWKRSTTILAIGKRGFIGEVLYFAPCGKKMKTIPDVMRYIDKHVITNLGRENFSFNTRVNVGEFFEQREENNTVKLNQEEIMERMSLIESKRQKMRRLKEQRGKKRSEKQHKNILLAKQMMEQKFKKKVEQQDMARKAAEYKLQKSLEKQRLKDMAQRIKNMKAMEKKKQQEQLRLLKEQEKIQRQEQMRMERELRAQQILEEREMKRQQAMLMKEQVNTDRERRRQHILLVKALEAQKKQAEKDRLKESKIAERRMSRERKMEQRRHELQLLRQLKRPMDDMQLKDLREMPEYPRIKGIELDGNAYADILMVLEFLHNFADALGFDNETLPTMRTLQEAVIGKNEDDMEDYIALTSHLTRYAVLDPGVPNPKEAVTKLGQKIVDVDINDGVVSEVLRIFITARNGKPNEMSNWLVERPLEALDQNQRASILAFLCNELLCGKSISSEIEKNLDHMGDIRRDKWVIEGKLRRLRLIQAKKLNRPKPKFDENTTMSKDGDDSLMTGNDGDESTMMSASKRGSDDEDDSGNEFDENQSIKEAEGEADEDENLTAEECEKKIEKLQKQHAQQRAKVFKASHRVRAIMLGDDRFKRRYWVLPKAGGVYVEGIESGAFDEENVQTVIKTEKIEVKTEPKLDCVKTEKLIKEEIEMKEEEQGKPQVDNSVKSEDDNKVDIKSENCDNSGKSQNSEEKKDADMETKQCNGIAMDTSLPSSAISSGEQTESKNIFLQNPSTSTLQDLCKLSTVKSESNTDSKSVIPQAHSSPLITPYSSAPSPFHLFFNSFPTQKSESPSFNSSPVPAHQHPKSSTPSSVDSKSSFLSIDTLLKKENDVKPSPSSPAFNAFPVTSNPMNASLGDEQKPWFSILPRLPCNDLSIAQVTSSMSSQFGSLPFFSPFSMGAFPLPNQTFSSFQMGQLPSKDMDMDSSMMSYDSSFKVPDTPKLDGLFDQMEMNTYDEPQPIPEEMTKGWWRIQEQEQLRDVMRCCHPRGIREKNLQKTLQKFQEYACESCSKGEKNVVSLEASEPESEENEPTDGEKKEEEKEGEDKQKKGRKKKKVGKQEEPVISHAHQVELTVLDLVENLEERVASASLQIKGWKVPQRISDESDIKLVDRSHVNLKDNERYPLDVAQEKLKNLEPNIERRYLKPPLCKNQQINLANITATSLNESRDSSRQEEPGQSGDENDNHEDTPPSAPVQVSSGLLTWRNAVAKATSAAQLTLCCFQLNNAISWEKSIMKVLCQICRKDDNEAMLLLCDGCDKGYHTYCFKPKMDVIPEGDWYCYACISKATGEPCCVVCGKRTGKIVECDHCPRAIHTDCLDPPLPRMPRKYSCPSCLANQDLKKRNKKSPKKRRESFVARERKDSENSVKVVEIPPVVEKKRGKNAEKLKTAEQSDDMTVCRTVLTELEKHDDGWPFLKPVNFKQFPTYKKYIKNPMDFTTMKNKLRDNLYKSRSEFAADTRLVFNNCMIFNEDESDVGKAGHSMRKFFENRWKELLVSDNGSLSTTQNGDEENS